MSRTYIGPFGRILPVLNDNDLEQSQVPSHEARSTMTTFQLPPPEKLDFGSDDTLGVTEPLRYSNVGSQAKKAHDRSNPAYSEPPRPHHHGLLPSVSSLLPPVSQSTIPPPRFPPHINAQLSHERINLQLDIRDPGSDRLVQNLQYAYHGSFPQPPAPLQAQSVTSRDSRGSDPQTNTSSHQISTAYNLHQSSAFAYPSHAPRSRELSYSPAQPQHQISPSNAHQVYYTPTPNPHHLQHPSPTDVPQPVQMLAVNAPSQYYQDHPNGYDINSTSTLGAEQTEHCSQPTENNAKPMPRVVGEADIPGQGPSWLYEDGTSCKKIIDGESVNAQWGVTKAGKPRKRLAIACTTCREKKIKCDPAEPKCVQCEKFGRECRFTTAFRNHRSSQESTSYDSQACTPSINIKIDSPSRPVLPSDSHSEDQTPPKRQNSLPIVIQVQRAASGDENDCYGKSPLKKQRPSFSRPTSPRPERKDRPCKNDTVVQKMEAMYRARDTRNGCTQAHSLLSVKEEMRLVEDLKIRRARALLAIEKKCDDGCREGLNPCSVLLQLETIHDGHYQSCKKGA